jgi:excisionase family DNA binding protein
VEDVQRFRAGILNEYLRGRNSRPLIVGRSLHREEITPRHASGVDRKQPRKAREIVVGQWNCVRTNHHEPTTNQPQTPKNRIRKDGSKKTRGLVRPSETTGTNNHPMTDTKPLLTSEQIAELLSLDVRTIYKLRKSRRIPFIKLSSRMIRFDGEAVLAHLARTSSIRPISVK